MSWRMLDLFTGLGGFTRAAHEVWGDELETVSFVEIDGRCREFLARAWPGIPIHDDIKTLDATQWRGTIDCLSAGIPCQPASRAGKQRGKEDDRWLWDEALRVCEECLPTWCLLENPPGIGDVGLDGILTHLEGIGYETQTIDIPACAVNSPQLRHRYWIICYRNEVGLADVRGSGREGSVTEPGTHGLCAEHSQSHMAYASLRGQRTDRSAQGSAGYADQRGEDCELVYAEKLPIGTGLCQEKPGWFWWGRSCNANAWSSSVWMPCAYGKVRRAPDDSQCMAHGLPVELSEALGEEGRQTPEDCEPHRSILAALGNSIVPQVAVEIFKAIKQAHERG